EASDLDKLADPTRLRREFLRLAMTSRLVQGTDFRAKFLRRWSEWQQTTPRRPDRTTFALRRELARFRAQRQKLQQTRDDLEKEAKPIPPDLTALLRDLTFEIDVLRFELSLRATEEVVQAQQTLRALRVAGAVGGSAGARPLTALPLLAPSGQELRAQF